MTHLQINKRRSALMLLVVGVWISLIGTIHADEATDATEAFRNDVLPVLESFCFDCHGDGADEGGLELQELKRADIKKWHAVWSNVKHELMPPSDAEQPSLEQRGTILNWVERYAMQLDPEKPDPGKVTIRRLNREEYRWTVRDILDVDFKTEEHFSPDDTGYGFDTVGDAQSVAPILTEKYVKAARDIAEMALPDPPEKRRPRSHEWILFDGSAPEGEKKRTTYRRKVIRRLADRAFRRPIDEPTLKRITALSEENDDGSETGFEESIRTAITIILISPRFLFRAESESTMAADTDDKQEVARSLPLDEYALASRLSFFLWSSAPDEELTKLAAEGKLRENMRSQVDRLLADYRSERFVENFVGQWLRTRDVLNWDIDAKQVLGIRSRRDADKIFSRDVRRAMRDETYDFFAHLLSENLSWRELLTADYTFLNERLAKFYDIPGVDGRQMKKVDLPEDSPRRGILTHGSVLLVTSNPTRTSPVKRGVFMLDNILGTPAPPPPPGVPELTEAKTEEGEELTMRQRIAIHREDALCSSCHSRMDPLGLAFESFNAIGKYRTEADGQPIKIEGELITGETFRDLRGLTEILANERRGDFYRCLTEKMLTYALGRGMEYYDIPTISKIVASLEKDDGKARTLIYEIVESPPFQMRRGTDYQPAVAANALPSRTVATVE